YRRLLYSLACSVLGDIQAAENALENWWRTASRSPTECDYEGAFRSWLVRVLIDEALAVLALSVRFRSAGTTLLGCAGGKPPAHRPAIFLCSDGALARLHRPLRHAQLQR